MSSPEGIAFDGAGNLYIADEQNSRVRKVTFEKPALTAATMISHVPSSTLGISNVQFTWTPVAGATSYGLWLGISGPGSSDIYSYGLTPNTSATVPSLPVKGAKIYARLFTLINGVIEYNDYN